MKNIFVAAIAIFLLNVSSLNNAKAGELEISNAFARASAGPARNGAVFLTVKNHAKQADILLSATTDVAKIAQLHGHTMKNGMMYMAQAEGGITVPSGGMAQLKPGGHHVMLMGLKAPLKKGEKITVTLTFKKAGEMMVNVPILGVGAKSALEHGNMGHMGHNK
jgi:copper(I)-binding protein